MNKIKKALVITTIANDRQPALNQYAKRCTELGIDFYIIGDKKSPDAFSIPGSDFWSLERQNESELKEFSKLLPVGHYSRKNIGYLAAIANSVDFILETDDDNIPYESFWSLRPELQNAQVIDYGGWVNVYRFFTKKIIWPRGFPLEEIQQIPIFKFVEKKVLCPIQQGLADDNPDVDAIFRLVQPVDIKFDRAAHPIALGKGSWCPFNSQNTVWYKEAFPLLYLPSYCSFRMTDIWRSFVAQRVSQANGWHILFYAPTVSQERNTHNLMMDFEDEIPGYLNNTKIKALLENVEITGGIQNILGDLFSCYKILVEAEIIGKKELPILEEWIKRF
jgi:hypothetical protein